MSLDVKAHLDKLVVDAYKQFEPIFENSSQAVYLYFEDDYLACNQNFADMLGYRDAEDLISGQWPFLRTFVTNDSQAILSSTYENTLSNLTGSIIDVVWKKKNGETVDTSVIMVPVVVKDHVMVMHFISEK